jgi:hypothetical protein
MLRGHPVVLVPSGFMGTQAFFNQFLTLSTATELNLLHDGWLEKKDFFLFEVFFHVSCLQSSAYTLR